MMQTTNTNTNLSPAFYRAIAAESTESLREWLYVFSFNGERAKVDAVKLELASREQA